MSDITLLDGSIGQELVKRTGDRATPLWSTQVMVDHPEHVDAVHRDYFNAGATIASTNTYAVLADRLRRVGLEDQLESLLNKALTAAQAARAAHGSGRIAGTLGPFGASYRPDISVSQPEAHSLYAPCISAMDNGVDLFLLETVPSIEHALVALAVTTALTDKPVWLAMTVDDDKGTLLRSGEPLSDLVRALADLPPDQHPDALLLNCSRPEAITDGLPALAASGLPFGAYANGFTRISEAFLAEFPTVDALEQRTDLTPETYAWFVRQWIDAGATIVGGCCEVGPAHIGELARQLQSVGHRLV